MTNCSFCGTDIETGILCDRCSRKLKPAEKEYLEKQEEDNRRHSEWLASLTEAERQEVYRKAASDLGG